MLEQYLNDLVPFAYVDPVGPAILQQQLVEPRAQDLVRMWVPVVDLPEIPAPGRLVAAPDHCGAPLTEEPCLLNGRQHSKLFQYWNAGRQQRFAYVVAGKECPFQEKHSEALARQHRGGGATCGPTSDYYDVWAGVCSAQWPSDLLPVRRPGRYSGLVTSAAGNISIPVSKGLEAYMTVCVTIVRSDCFSQQGIRENQSHYNHISGNHHRIPTGYGCGHVPSGDHQWRQSRAVHRFHRHGAFSGGTLHLVHCQDNPQRPHLIPGCPKLSIFARSSCLSVVVGKYFPS